MKALQASILALVLIIAVCAMAFTGLKTASEFWYNALYTFTAVLLLSSVIAARVQRGNAKAFWFGFALFGWALFVVGLGPWPNFDTDPDAIRITLNRHLLTSQVIDFLVPYWRAPTNDLGEIDKITGTTTGIIHLVITLAIGASAGIVAVVIRRKRGRLLSVKSLTVLAGLAVVVAAVTSMTVGRRSGLHRRFTAFRNDPSLKTLAKEDPGATAYQLTWSPTFHHPVRVRIDFTREGAMLRARVLDGKGGYNSGQVAIDKRVRLDAAQTRELERHVEEAAFWTMPTEEKMDGFVTDGDTLFLEGAKRGTYHGVPRILPGPAFTRLCHYMLDLTGLEIRVWSEYHSNEDEPEM